jgi:exopolyphosphatase/pppGpp-phosphohydrolase
MTSGKRAEKSGHLRIGLIEVGSRAIRLLVADFDRLSNFTPVKIDTLQHGIDPSEIEAGDVDRINEIIMRLEEAVSKFSCDRVAIYGTEICRRISSLWADALDGRIKVLTPREEAMASWAAGILCEDNKRAPIECTVIDEGNASTEIATGHWNGKLVRDFKYMSLSVGSADLMEMYRADSKAYLQRLIVQLGNYRATVAESLGGSSGSGVVYLAGGVATKLGWFKVRKSLDDFYQPHRVNGARLSVSILTSVFAELSKMFKADPDKARRLVDARAGSEDEVVRIIASAPFLAIVRNFVDNRDELKITGYGVRHGMAFLIMNDLLEADGV